MNNNSEERLQIKLGNFNLKLFEIKTYQSSKDTYFYLGIPDVGLHYSFHNPKPPLEPNSHLHLRSKKLNIHEDIPFSIDDWFSSFAGFAEELNETLLNSILEPSADEQVTVLPFSTNAFEFGDIDIGRIMQSICGTYYRTSVSRLPMLMQEKPCLRGTFAISDRGIVVPLDEEDMFEIPFKISWDIFNRISSSRQLRSFYDPLTRAFETIQKDSPESIQKWVPSSARENIGQEIGSILRKSNFQIIDF
jgi:hypothetical protein